MGIESFTLDNDCIFIKIINAKNYEYIKFLVNIFKEVNISV